MTVFVSPKLKGSIGNSFSEVFYAAMLAKRVFSLVLFISYDDEEIAFVDRHQALFDGPSVAPLLVSPDREELLAQLDVF